MESERRKKVALIQAIGTANPPTCYLQADYPELYFEITKSQHLPHLKDKLKRICVNSKIKKRYMLPMEEIVEKNPNIRTYGAPSLDARQDILVEEVPKLAMEAAMKAIEEWGEPAASITHLVFCTSSEISAPSADRRLAKLIGLKPSVQKFIIYQQGCYAGGTALRLAKDVVENNEDAHVLVVCCEIYSLCRFQGPSETRMDILVGAALMGDGAAAVIISGGNGGGNSEPSRGQLPLFEIVSATQTEILNTEDVIGFVTCEAGVRVSWNKAAPKVVAENIEQCLAETFAPLGVENWNELFYAVHTGGAAILRGMQEKLGLAEGKLDASWSVLSEYGNMGSPCVLFVLDALRKKSMGEGRSTTGDGLEMGVLVGFGPGLTVETVALKSVPLKATKK
ncbi:unnamed protein product [Bemisia tabaci]|uniref:Chalcone synthase n=1 Tax=Bemisia tabaci TaxID=7038 RepID=A0A9P0F9Q0_BEMTA|nr:unnamed protein product [Bemisia tabaci]